MRGEDADQVGWFEVRETSHGRTTIVSDHDTRDRAEVARQATQALCPDGVFITVRVSGLG